MIGNLEDAQTIYRRRKSGYGPLPKGWKKLGEGADRTAYLCAKKVVYKVAHDSYCPSANDIEADNYVKFRRKKRAGWKLAKVYPHTWTEEETRVTVNACEYIGGEEEDYYLLNKKETREAFEHFGSSDWHTGNYRLVGSVRVIIDLG